MHDIAQINARLPLRIDWKNTLCRVLGVHAQSDLTQCLANFAQKHHVAHHGLLTPELRLTLIQTFPDLRIQLLGTKTAPRLLFNTNDETQLYDNVATIVRARDGNVFDLPYVPQILAIRGASHTNDGRIFQTDSAHAFANTTYGHRTHFSSQKTPFDDTVFILFWRDPQKHARIFTGTSNPNMIWPHGTAHLCDGQYTFKLGKHRTFSQPHIDAVLSNASTWPSDWLYERDDKHVRYIALEGISPVNVIRSHDDSLDLSHEDIMRAEHGFAYYDPAYTNTQSIKINIHTCPLHEASSLGCQNILPDQYADFIAHIQMLETQSAQAYGFACETYFTLTDASKI